MSSHPTFGSRFSRRKVLATAIAAGAASALHPITHPATAAAEKAKTVVTKGNIKQSLVFWCFNVSGDKWDIEKQCEVAKQLGCVSIELGDHKDFPVIKKRGLTCAIAGNRMPGAPFMRGLNNPAYHDEVIARTKEAIDGCAEYGYGNVIAFTGYKWKNAEDPKSGEISLEEGADNCVKALKVLCAYADKKNVNICVEHLNTRDDSHPMKGHTGYQGDHIDYVADIARRVGSPRAKILFDVYHVQIMDGDVIRRIEQCKDVIGHIHTAGNPGRAELDDKQEINYPPIMRKLLEIGYKGFVGQEFIPTRDPLVGLTEAVKLCDV